MNRQKQCLVSVFWGLAALAIGQPFWAEHFDDSFKATTHWTHDGNNAGPSRWEWTDKPADGYVEPGLAPFGAPTAADGYFLFNSDANGPTPHDVWLTNINRPVNCSHRVGVYLRFYTQYIYFSPAGTRAQLGVSTDGETFEYLTLFEGHPANLPFEGWVELPLPLADNQPQVFLRFRWIGNYEYHWKVDDLQLLSVLTSNPDSCETAIDITSLFGQTPGDPQTSPIFDNTHATASSTDPDINCWLETPLGEPDFLDNTLWFTFIGDGKRYDIQTVPCNAQNYVGTQQGSLGDTQMALFAGEDCAHLTMVACNDDLSPMGDPDWRAGLLVHTEPGRRYYLLVDGYRSLLGPAQGEFCLQITPLREVPCSAGAVGTFSVGRDGLVCHNSSLMFYLKADTTAFVLPTEGEVFGLAWCLSSQPLSPDVWPGDISGISSTVFLPTFTKPSFINDGSFLPFGAYYLTPVVLGSGVLLGPGPAFVFNVRPDSNGCFFVGASMRIVLLPPLSPLSATLQVTNETVPPGQNGAIAVMASGGSGAFLNSSAVYEYFWSHGGPNAAVVTQLSQGTYTVTIADKSTCVPAIKRDATVQLVVGIEEPTANALFFEVFPNPAAQALWIRATLPLSGEVQIDILNSLGQRVQGRRGVAAAELQELFDISHLAPGLYTVRLSANGATGIRRLVIGQP